MTAGHRSCRRIYGRRRLGSPSRDGLCRLAEVAGPGNDRCGLVGGERRADRPEVVVAGDGTSSSMAGNVGVGGGTRSVVDAPSSRTKSRKVALSWTRGSVPVRRRRRGSSGARRAASTPRGRLRRSTRRRRSGPAIWPSSTYQVSSRSSWTCSAGAWPTGKRHLEHDALHVRGAAMLDDEVSRNHQASASRAAWVVDHCCVHVVPSFPSCFGRIRLVRLPDQGQSKVT